MLSKYKVGLRELSSGEIDFVSGGNIVVSGSNFQTLTPDDLALVNETLGGPVIVVPGNLGEQTEQAPPDDDFHNISLIPLLPSYEQWKEDLQAIIKELLKLNGYDVIDPDDQAALNQELNSKEQAFTVPADENGPRTTFTRDGTAYVDRNGDGAVDIKMRTSPFGNREYDTGDGTGWRMY